MRAQRWLLLATISVLILATVLSACSAPAAPTATPQPQPTAASLGGVQPTAPAAPRPAGFNWRRFEGQEVFVLLNKHPVAEAMIGLIPDFEARTGIKVIYEVLAETEYLEKQRLEYAAGTGLYDVTMVSPGLHFRLGEAGWEEPLDQYLTAEWTDLETYNVDDFYPALLNVNRWNLKTGCGLSEGALYGIPMMTQSMVLTYRGDLLDKYELAVPETIEDLYNYARTVQEGEKAAGNPNFVGGVVRGHPTQAAGLTHGSIAAAYAKNTDHHYDFVITEDCEFKSVVNDPALVDVMTKYIATMKDYGPIGWTSVVWYDGQGLFCTGNYGFFADCDFFASTYEDPSMSQVAGKARYTYLPRPKGGEPYSNGMTWALGISAASRRKGPAWYLIQFMSSPAALKTATLEYNNFNPVRKSVMEDPDVQALMGKWGQGSYIPTVTGTMAGHYGVLYTPQRQQSQTNERLGKAMHQIWTGEKDAQTALDEAAVDIDEIMRKGDVKPHPDCCK